MKVVSNHEYVYLYTHKFPNPFQQYPVIYP